MGSESLEIARQPHRGVVVPVFVVFVLAGVVRATGAVIPLIILGMALRGIRVPFANLRNGHGNQGCHLAGIPDALGYLLLAHADVGSVPHFKQPSFVHGKSVLEDAFEDIHRVETDVPVPETQRMQLAKARVGQGLFCKRLILVVAPFMPEQHASLAHHREKFAAKVAS